MYCCKGVLVCFFFVCFGYLLFAIIVMMMPLPRLQITLTKIAFLTDGPASQVELLLARRSSCARMQSLTDTIRGRA